MTARVDSVRTGSPFVGLLEVEAAQLSRQRGVGRRLGVRGTEGSDDNGKFIVSRVASEQRLERIDEGAPLDAIGVKC